MFVWLPGGLGNGRQSVPALFAAGRTPDGQVRRVYVCAAGGAAGVASAVAA